MQKVLVLDKHKHPLMPCSPARARRLLNSKKAAVFRRYPFTIILKERAGGELQPVELKLDPGSKTTGIALVSEGETGKKLCFAANLQHRGQLVKESLDSRRAIRRSRRNRTTRYRKPRFLNRTRPEGWLPPSLISRVQNVETWSKRLCRSVPVTSIAVETVRFDTQIMENPNIAGTEYQRGTLFGTELREYLLYRHGHQCCYCKGASKDTILNVEHFVPRAKKGSNRLGNLFIACRKCNEDKDSLLPETWLESLKKSKSALNRVRVKQVTKLLGGQRPKCYRDAAAANATRYATGNAVKSIGLPTTFWSGGRTKFNRTQQGYSKDHWIDAACVGETGVDVKIARSLQPLLIKATGRGSRQMCRVNKYGFPRTKAKGAKIVKGFQTGDIVKAVVPSGKKQGTYVGKVAVRSSGSFNITAGTTLQGISYRHCTLLQKTDGYAYY